MQYKENAAKPAPDVGENEEKNTTLPAQIVLRNKKKTS